MPDTTDKILGCCETCAGDIEYVPTPEGADPTWYPPMWRHITYTSPTACVAKPRPADVEAVR